jgi:hypothetical protein
MWWFFGINSVCKLVWVLNSEHGAFLLDLPDAYSKIWIQLLANFLLSLVHVHCARPK